MTTHESAILDALRELERLAALVRAGQPQPGIRPLLAQLDRLGETLDPTAPADLRHYLQRKSYEKARLFLEGRDAENTPGACGH